MAPRNFGHEARKIEFLFPSVDQISSARNGNAGERVIINLSKTDLLTVFLLAGCTPQLKLGSGRNQNIRIDRSEVSDLAERSDTSSLGKIGLQNIFTYEKELLEYGTKALRSISDLRMIGAAKEKAAVLSFVLPNIHPHDLGTLVDEDGIAIRTGHHCTMPIMQRFGVPATARASLVFYNTKQEIDQLIAAIKRAKEVFQ